MFFAVYAAIGAIAGAWFLWDMRDPGTRREVMDATIGGIAPGNVPAWAAIIALAWPVVLVVRIFYDGED